MSASEWVYRGVTEQSDGFVTGELDPVELTEAYLARIRAVDGQLRSFITVLEDEAREAAGRSAERLRAGERRSRLDGIPFAVKDQMLIEGVRVTGGSRVLADFVGSRDATVVRRLREAGAVLLGTLNTHEFHSGMTRDPLFGKVRNPWNLERSPGASSSGSAAAVAAGLCSFSLGGDTGGSIRAPASYCGVVGLKATWSRVSRDGVIPLAYSMDCVGPLARRVEDTALVLEHLAGADPADPTCSRLPVPRYSEALSGELSGLRVGVIAEMLDPSVVQPAAIATTEAAVAVLRELGATVTTVSVPLLHQTRFISVALVMAEAASHHRKWLLERYEDYDVNTRTNFLTGALLPAGALGQAQRMRALVARQVVSSLEEVDVLVGPTADAAFPLRPRDPLPLREEVRASLRMPAMASGPQTRVFSLSGHPSLSVPCGFDPDGLPLGLQLATRHFDEATLLRVAHAYEARTPWHTRRPAFTASTWGPGGP
ncbi:MAG: amidase family protein [Trueperaceae bacterium]|nr:amidase family protein [Trueperaceae bacterium]